MSSSRRSSSPSPSTSSVVSDSGSNIPSEETETRVFAKRLLIKRMFLGQYQERRYVESLNFYRDIVVLHRSEAELKFDIERVLSRLNSYYGGKRWIGITSPEMIGGPAAGYCLWTKLQDLAFGFYWFQIREIFYDDKEVRIRLRMIRPVAEEVMNNSTTHFKISSFADNIESLKSSIITGLHSLKESSTPAVSSDQGQTEIDKTEKVVPVAVKKRASDRKENLVPDSTTAEPKAVGKNEILNIDNLMLLLHLIFSGWKHALISFPTTLIGTLNLLGKCVHYVGEFSLRFMHEVAFLMRAVTPIVVAVIELVGKLVGGLYLLIAMLFRGHHIPPQRLGPPPHNRGNLSIDYPSVQSRRPLSIDYPSVQRMRPQFNDNSPVQSRRPTMYKSGS